MLNASYLHVKGIDIDELTPCIEAFINETPELSHRAVVNSAERIRSLAQLLLTTRVKHMEDMTWNIHDSIRVEILDNGTAQVICDDPASVYVEEGTEGPIRPISSKFLHFWMEGEEYFMKEVRGQEGKHFFRDACESEDERYGTDIEMIVIKTMEEK